jgi:hypothetical protein
MDMQDDFDEPLTAEQMEQEIAKMVVQKKYYRMKQEVSQLRQQSRISQGLSPSSKGTSRCWLFDKERPWSDARQTQ